MSRLHIPLIRSLDLTYPDKYFRPMDWDPEDNYRAALRIERRRLRANLPPRTHDQILHHAALMEVRVSDHGGGRWVMR